MSGYVSNFKKFMKSEEKKEEKVGANPIVDEQATDTAASTTQPTTDQPEATPAPTVTIDADPGVQNATKTLNNLNKQLADLQKTIADANANLSTARATAANTLVTKPA